jgi:hypothetical protein
MSLSSLIVQREIATIRQVEEALARQVLYGGDLVTNLLEVAKLDEPTLTLLLAESFGIQAATLGPLPDPTEKARALMPPELASSRAVVPLATEGSTLVVAVPEPLTPEVLDELIAAMGIGITQRIAPMLRIREALARTYGAPLERRLQRLLNRLANAQGPSVPPSLGATEQAPPLAETVPPARKSTLPMVPLVDPPQPVSSRTNVGFPAPAPLPGAPADVQKASLIEREAAIPARPPRRRRGPITPDAATKELDEAPDRDAILDLFFDYSRQYFDYSALFVVHGDIAEGRDAYGDGASRDRVTGIGVPLDLPSILAHARARRAPVQGALAEEGLDPVLLGDLQRKTRGEVLIVPIVVRTRTVALFYGDSGDLGVEAPSVKEVVAFAARVGQAFEKLIVRRKAQGVLTGQPMRPSSSRVRAEEPEAGALASASRPSRSPLAESIAPPPSPSLRMPVPHDVLTPLVPPLGAPPVIAQERRSAPPVDRASAPPPMTVAAVRRPTGRPIPREEPEPSAPPWQDTLTVAPVALAAPPSDTPAETIGESEYADAPPTPRPSESIAIAPHRPPSAHAGALSALPSVIVDVDQEFGAMVDRVLASGWDDAAEAELLRQGHHAMPAIMTRFPGPTTPDRSRAEEGTMRVAECGPLLRLVAGQRRVAVPFVLPLLADANVERRYWATLLLTELAYPETIDALVPRLFDPDPSVRRVARLAARAVGDVAPDALIDRLGKQFNDPAAPSSRRLEMVDALGELRERLAVPILVEALADADDEVIGAARRALMVITRQDFARDAKKWLAWWHVNAPRHRIEWLIDALMHDVPAVRRASGDELKAVTKEYFGYYDDLPKRERERAQQRYRDWWTTEGRQRFRRS